jgi:hypothetical protein
MLLRIASLVEQSGRFADEQSFASQSGPAWDRLRQLLDDPTPRRSKDRP